MTNPVFIRMRFAFKLTFAILLALVLAFVFDLATPRWAALSAALVAAGPAYAVGGEPFSGALRHRSVLRIIGTFAGCLIGILIIINTARAPAMMLMLCCIWAGFCSWLASIVRLENSYAFSLAGYTALIIVVTVSPNEASLLEAPRFAVERCSEIVLGILCVILADILFSPRSIKQDIDRLIDKVLVDQYRLMQLCVNGAEREEVDRVWSELVKNTNALNGMRTHLMLESPRWQRVNQRMKVLNTLSLSMITQACETFLILDNHPQRLRQATRELFDEPATTHQEVHRRMKLLRQILPHHPIDEAVVSLSNWVGASSRYLLVAKGIHTNASVSKVEEGILKSEVVVKVASSEGHHAVMNGLRTWIAAVVAGAIWLWTGWTAGPSMMVMLAIVISLAIRAPNPRRMATDFTFGMLLSIPVGGFYFAVIMPATEQSLLLLCISLGIMTFVIGLAVQKRLLGSMGAMLGIINVLVLNNPMSFNFTQFIDGAFGQFVGCLVSLLVVLLIRDKSKGRTGRTLLNRFVSSAVAALTTRPTQRKQNHLPALYQQLNQLLAMFPGDIAKYRLALLLILAHQRLLRAHVPQNDDLSAYHRRIRHTADRVVAATTHAKRSYYYFRLLSELAVYQSKLVDYQADSHIVELVQRLQDTLHEYQTALIP